MQWRAKIHPPCVNRGEFKTCIRGDDVYVGFIHINGLETAVGKAIENVRCTMYDVRTTGHPAADCRLQTADPGHLAGGYTSLEDFIERVPASLEQVIILIRAGAFRFTGKPKTLLLWEAHMLMGKHTQVQGGTKKREENGKALLPGTSLGRRDHNKEQSLAADHAEAYSGRPEERSRITIPAVTPSLFQAQPKKFELPALEQSMLEEVYDEIELLGWPVSHSYFELLETRFRGEIMAREMMGKVGKTVRMLGLLVTIKYVRTVRKEWMHFGTFIDFDGQFFDTVHFPQAVEKYPFRGEGVYLIMGKIVEEFGFPSLEVSKMAKMPLKKDPRS